MKTGLILIDIQNDYFPGGKMELAGMEEASANSARLLNHFRKKGMPTFHIQHIFEDAGAPFFVAETEGVKLHESIAPAEGEKVIVKRHPNSFLQSRLIDDIEMENVERVVICGAMSHMCVDATTRAAADFGLKCAVAHDACATRDLEFGGKTVSAADVQAAYMSALGWGYAEMKTAEELLTDE